MRGSMLVIIGMAAAWIAACGSNDDSGGSNTGGTAGAASGGSAGASGGSGGSAGATGGTTATGGAAGTSSGGAAGASGGAAGTSSGGTAGADGGTDCTLTGNNRPFGSCCTDNAQCTSNLCFAFGDGTQACTQTCNSNNDCPAGSQGKKCNNQNVCRP
jgi:hypothetical protein